METVYCNFKGGIISPGYLWQLLQVASEAQVKSLRFGLRQQLIMQVREEKMLSFASACVEKNISFYRAVDAVENIVSSYAGTGIFTADSWLSEGVYKDVFDLFQYQPLLKINVCDSRQTFTPLFSGHLNWIASEHLHYWFLYIRFPASDNIFCWPELIYTNDIANISVALEKVLLSKQVQQSLNNHSETTILSAFRQLAITYISMPVKEPLAFKPFHLPYYEGFNKDGDSYWLGIYRRDEEFSIDFLKDVCVTCLQTNIGQIYITSWKSIIIKNIAGEDRKRWDLMLGNYRINVRHAANELNWQVEDMNEDGLILKRHIIRFFDKEDVRTYGLCFAIQTLPLSSMFGSVIIRRHKRKQQNHSKSTERFDILYRKDFNPNSGELTLFREKVEKAFLGPFVSALCKFYYQQQVAITSASQLLHESKPGVSAENQKTFVYQCSFCLSVYDNLSLVEDPPSGPQAFSELPDTYCCPLCGENKSGYKQVEQGALYHSLAEPI